MPVDVHLDAAVRPPDALDVLAEPHPVSEAGREREGHLGEAAVYAAVEDVVGVDGLLEEPALAP